MFSDKLEEHCRREGFVLAKIKSNWRFFKKRQWSQHLNGNDGAFVRRNAVSDRVKRAFPTVDVMKVQAFACSQLEKA